jgi:hypothetical protein
LLTTDELAKIPAIAPDIVVVAADTGNSWAKQPQSALRLVFENYKVIAVGAGSKLFAALGLEIDSDHAMGDPSGTSVIVQNQALLKSPQPISASDGFLQVSQPGGTITGVYDEGSPDIAGFEGIAKWKNHPDHWPIARQGNYVFWGFDLPPGQLTDAGKRVFVNLLFDQRSHPAVPLSQARRKLEYVQPGPVSDRLNAQFPTGILHFQVRRPGRILAKVSWNPAQRSLALILNGPGQVGGFARKDGVSPLEIMWDVTDKNISAGIDWLIKVTAFGDVGSAVIDYKLDLSFPAASGAR